MCIGLKSEQLTSAFLIGNVHSICLFFRRYVAAQRYPEALDILESGASIQLKHGQVMLS